MEKKIYKTPVLRKLDVEETRSGENLGDVEGENYGPTDIDPS